ncbi:unnamed protein product [Discosporangium mesarthrocarpum]
MWYIKYQPDLCISCPCFPWCPFWLSLLPAYSSVDGAWSAQCPLYLGVCLKWMQCRLLKVHESSRAMCGPLVSPPVWHSKRTWKPMRATIETSGHCNQSHATFGLA